MSASCVRVARRSAATTAAAVLRQGLAALGLSVLAATAAAAQSDGLKRFREVRPLEGASPVVREIMGFEIAHGPDGFVLGGYNLLNGRLPNDFDTGRVLPRVDVQPLDGARLACTDMACLESALQAGLEFMQPGGFPLRPEARGGPVFMVSLSRSDALDAEYERARHIVYATTGILFSPKRTSSVEILAVAPGSPAEAAGLRPGYELTRIDREQPRVDLLASTALKGAPFTLYWRADPGSLRETEGGIAPRTGTLAVVDGIVGFDGAGGPSGGGLPAPFRTLADEAGLMALLQGKPDLAPEQERRVAALRLLEGWSADDKGRSCMTGPVERIDIRTSITVTERNLAGQSRTTLDTSSVDPLFVELRFVPFVRSMSADWSSPETRGAIERAAGELIRLEGCEGASVQQLKAEISALAGVPFTPARAAASSGGFQPDWRSFMAQCYPAHMQRARADGRNLPERGAVALCVCVEYAAAEYGDPEIYARYRAWSFDGIPQETLEAIWALTQAGACSRAGNPEDPVLVQRYETFLRDNGL